MNKRTDKPDQPAAVPPVKPTDGKTSHPLTSTDPKVLSELIRRVLTDDKN